MASKPQPRHGPAKWKQVVVLLDDECQEALDLLTSDKTSKSAAIRAAIFEAALRLPDQPRTTWSLGNLPHGKAMEIIKAGVKAGDALGRHPLTEHQKTNLSIIFRDAIERLHARGSNDQPQSG